MPLKARGFHNYRTPCSRSGGGSSSSSSHVVVVGVAAAAVVVVVVVAVEEVTLTYGTLQNKVTVVQRFWKTSFTCL